jgi:hypothetical protein
MKNTLKRRKYIAGAEKIHTSVYLLPRHRAHIELLMRARGESMTDCICFLIDQSIKNFRLREQK